MLCQVFLQRRQGKEDKLRAKNTETLCQLRQHLGYLFFESNFSTPSFIYAVHIFPLLPQLGRCAPEKDVPAQDQLKG